MLSCTRIGVNCQCNSTAVGCGRLRYRNHSSKHSRTNVCMHVCRFSLVGHDWGAALAWRMAGSLRGRVRQLVAVSVGHPGARAPVSASVYQSIDVTAALCGIYM